MRLRLTLAYVQRSVASIHFWQQNGLTWSKTEVATGSCVGSPLGLPERCLVAHFLRIVCRAFMLRSGCSREHGATRRGSQRSWTRRVYGYVVQPNRTIARAMSPRFGHCSGWQVAATGPTSVSSRPNLGNGHVRPLRFRPSLAHFHQRDLFGFWPSLEIARGDSALALGTLASGPVV